MREQCQPVLLGLIIIVKMFAFVFVFISHAVINLTLLSIQAIHTEAN